MVSKVSSVECVAGQLQGLSEQFGLAGRGLSLLNVLRVVRILHFYLLHVNLVSLGYTTDWSVM